MSGELKKLTIEAYKTIKYAQADRLGEFSVMFNPTSYGLKYEAEYEAAEGKGATGSTQKFVRIKPQDYTFEFVVDGTGASSEKKEVSDVIEEFLRLTAETVSETHRPPFLKVSWGDLVCACILKSANITYALFNADGSPLRAKVDVTFSECIEDKKRIRKEGYGSPDVTHQRVVQEGDTLPLLTYRMYGDPSYYIKVARFNGLTDFRDLEVGSTLRFPPLKQQKTPWPTNA
jgi:nucleoid-associated protein YgaU